MLQLGFCFPGFPRFPRARQLLPCAWAVDAVDTANSAPKKLGVRVIGCRVLGHPCPEHGSICRECGQSMPCSRLTCRGHGKWCPDQIGWAGHWLPCAGTFLPCTRHHLPCQRAGHAVFTANTCRAAGLRCLCEESRQRRQFGL